MLPRVKRYRFFVVFAVITIFFVYNLHGSRSWQDTVTQHLGLQNQGDARPGESRPVNPENTVPNRVGDDDKFTFKPVGGTTSTDKSKSKDDGKDSGKPQQAPSPAEVEAARKEEQEPLKPTKALFPGIGGGSGAGDMKVGGSIPKPLENLNSPGKGRPEMAIPLPGDGRGRFEIAETFTPTTTIHWAKQTQHFPVSSTIPLPPSSPTAKIPKIQFDFASRKESGTSASSRADKLKLIKKTFLKSWESYKKQAWGHDELKPLTGGFKDPFGGWGATLVDTLDTLYIMGLRSEFDEAVKAVGDIDFTTSVRSDIPVFETVIRYLGGMLAAYDLTGRDEKYHVLLDKSIELGDILIGTFDTPNRMPQTFYHWKPAFASQPHRSGAKIVLAELGSLSVEFTRLAQMTGNDTYYDAIARVTDALDLWQNSTRLPGMWPLLLDASGCSKTEGNSGPRNKNKEGPTAGMLYKDTPGAGAPPITPAGSGAVYKPGAKPGDKPEEEFKALPVKEPNAPLDKPDPFMFDKGSRLTSAGKVPAVDVIGGGAPNTVDDSEVPPGNVALKKPPAWGFASDNPRVDAPAAGSASTASQGSTDKAAEPRPPIVAPEGVGGGAPNTVDAADVPAGEVALEKPPAWGFSPEVKKGSRLAKRDTDDREGESTHIVGGPGMKDQQSRTPPSEIHDPYWSPNTCPEAGLQPYTRYGPDTFAIGGQADSTYEYLPKEWLLLGGNVDQYKKMYTYAADTMKENIITRQMIPESKRITLAAGVLETTGPEELFGDRESRKYRAENGHLTCFAGGMFAMGAKIFDRPEELEIAKALTDGCIWAYEITPTGVMPETYRYVPCTNSESCDWDEDVYWRALDPYEDQRLGKTKNVDMEKTLNAMPPPPALPQLPKTGANGAAAPVAPVGGAANPGLPGAPPAAAGLDTTLAPGGDTVKGFGDAGGTGSNWAAEDATKKTGVQKRQLDISSTKASTDASADGKVGGSTTNDNAPNKDKGPAVAEPATDMGESRAGSHSGAAAAAHAQAGHAEIGATSTSGSAAVAAPKPADAPAKEAPKVPPVKSHEEFVKDRIAHERLPPGMTGVSARKYILRPEAIESVWYMYRITGEEYWREKGWKMFESIIALTDTVYGASAVDDVTKTGHSETLAEAKERMKEAFDENGNMISTIDWRAQAGPIFLDDMESFWLAETLKYFWLLFEKEDVISLDEWILNTEAHPLRRPDAPKMRKASEDFTF